jgi:exodeoxyribonuclease V alpha subunit
MPMPQLTAEILDVRYRNPTSGWSVLRCKDRAKKREFLATGSSPEIHSGQIYQFDGDWEKHDQYGLQFKFERCLEVEPTDTPSILRYLSSGLFDGVGKATAQKIIDHFGSKTIETLDTQPERLLQVKGLSRKKALAIKKLWQDQRCSKKALAFLFGHGFGLATSQKIFERYGDQTTALVSENPYRLSYEIRGIGFLKADELAKSMGMALDSLDRISAAIFFVIKNSEDEGHCYLCLEQIRQAVIGLLQMDLPEGLFLGALDGLIQKNILIRDIDNYYRKSIYLAEEILAEIIYILSKKKPRIDMSIIETWLGEFEKNLTLSEEQRNAVLNILQSPMGILTGGPGVGKTTTSNTIIKLLKFLGKNVAICAPTGRAAQRIGEVSQTEAKTIHRLLMYDGEGFVHNEENPLKVDVLVIDESSMIDIRLAASLFKAIKKDCQLIVIGDMDQLPSVGPGQVLRDLIESKLIPTFRLSQIFRQAASSKIIVSAHNINKGLVPELDTSGDCKFIPASSNEEIRSIIIKLMLDTIPAQGRYDTTEIQILSPMKKGEVGTENLNLSIQNLLRGTTEALQLGDRVIQTVNNYDIDVFNGDIGVIVSKNQKGLAVKIQDRIVEYPGKYISELQLAYAITIHKSQGSEFPVVLIPLTSSHNIMLERNLFYTALTRAKSLCVFIGQQAALKRAVMNQKNLSRQTTLKQKIEAFFDH